VSAEAPGGDRPIVTAASGEFDPSLLALLGSLALRRHAIASSATTTRRKSARADRRTGRARALRAALRPRAAPGTTPPSAGAPR
jgi:hypothetical protein